MTRSRAPAIAALGIGVAGLAVGAVLLLLGSESDDDRDADPGGPVRIGDRSIRVRPMIALDPFLDPSRPPPATLVYRVDLDGHVGAVDDGHGDDRDRDLSRVVDEALAQVTSMRGRFTEGAAPATGRSAPSTTTTTNPNDLDVTGLAVPAPRDDEPDPPTGPAALGTRAASSKASYDEPEIVDSGLPEDVVRRVIRRSMVPIRACYDQALLTQPTLEGTVQVIFEIGRDGRVPFAQGMGVDDAVAECVAAVIRGLQFPQPDGGGRVRVRYPFAFRPT